MNRNITLLLGAVLCFLTMELPFIVDVRPVMVDEAWYANTGYNLIHGNGFTNTIVGNGGNANFIAPAIIAGMMFLFGDSLLAIRLAAVLCGVLTLFVFHLIMNFMKVSTRSRVLGYSLFVGITVINSTFRYGRPEFAALLFVTLGIYAFFRYRDKSNIINMSLLSIATLLATCSHPYSLLIFALMGASLLFEFIKTKQLSSKWSHLLMLMLAAVISLLLILLIGSKYNLISDNSNSFITTTNRLGGSNLLFSLRTYLKDVFVSKYSVVTLPGLVFIIWASIKSKDQQVKTLSIITLLFLLIFPFIFAEDLNMIGNAASFFVLIAIIIATLQYDEYDKSSAFPKNKLSIYYICLAYALVNCAVTVYFNFGVKYEKANSIMAEEIDKVIPDNSLVFGPMKQWPCKMNCRYYSDHSRYSTLPCSFEYIITNEQDRSQYSSYQEVLTNIDKYDIVYRNSTKQYGEVIVYKLKDAES